MKRSASAPARTQRCTELSSLHHPTAAGAQLCILLAAIGFCSGSLLLGSMGWLVPSPSSPWLRLWLGWLYLQMVFTAPKLSGLFF